jgi:tRNA threonylcarbamoyladenosine biosynthesis protein TsaE
MATFTSHSPEETFALGEAWGREAAGDWLVGLTGELGAGKTQLVKGIARGLGVKARIQSPTFALVNEYSEGRLALAHIDLFRLETPEQIFRAGLDQYFREPRGVVVVEWCERWPEFDGEVWTSKRKAAQILSDPSSLRLRRVWIETVSETVRCIRYEDSRA